MPVKLYSGGSYVDLKWWTFPGGERNVQILGAIYHKSATVEVQFKGSDDLIDMLLLVNAARNLQPSCNLHAVIPYFPFARQDRVMIEGEPLALQVAVELVKYCNFKTVTVLDPHSDVLAGMFPAGVLQAIPQHQLAANRLKTFDLAGAALVSPDAGALKKIYKLAKVINLPVVEATKVREVSTGKITSTKVPDDVRKYIKLVVVDDIIDGGRTFVELAREIEKLNPSCAKVLYATHGIFSNGRGELLKYYETILCANEIDKGVNYYDL